MTKLVPLQLTGPAYQHPSLPSNNQRCVNLLPTYPMPGPQDALEHGNPLMEGRGKCTLLRTMGTYKIGSIDTGGSDPVCRGLYQIQISPGDYLTVIVVNQYVYNLNFDATNLTISPVLLGTLTTGDGIVKISSNATQIIFMCYDPYAEVAGGSIYNYQTNTFTTITDPDFLGGSTVAMIDGYFFYNQVGSDAFWSSDLNDGTAWNGLNVAKATSKPDKLVALGQTKGELWVFGSDSIEVWYDNANTPGMPFSKRIGSDLDIGCSAAYSIQSVNDSLVFLDSRRFIVMSAYSQFFRQQSSGYQLTKLSNEAIDAEIASYPIVSDAVASTYNDNGHIMYEITFPSMSKTWVCDVTLGMWHEKTYVDPTNGIEKQALTNFYVQNEKYIIGASLSNNNIYLVSRNYLDDDGVKIRRKRTTQFIPAGFCELEIAELEVKFNTGIVALGANPGVTLRYSNDSGYTWSSPMERDLGTTGQYGKRIIWGPLGSAYEWLFEFTITDAVDFSIIDAAMRASLGSN